jgi:hypothetical protein
MKLRENFEAGGEEMVGAPQNPGEWAVSVVPGSGLPADQVELRDTNVKAYVHNPDLARMEQENALARWGGKAIDGSYLDEGTGKVVHPTPAGGPPDKSNAPYGQPRAGQITPEYNRREFERSVFNQIGGNPFEIDVIKEVDKATATDLPYLFRNVFGGRLIWEDRNRMDEKQRQFWDNEVKKYRAYVKERVESDKKTKIDLYNQMTKMFDNEQKEHEAAAKKVAEREKQWRERYEKDQEKQSKANNELLRTQREMATAERNILKDMNSIAKGDGGKITPEQSQMLQLLGQQLKELYQQKHAYLMANDPGYRTKQEKEERARQSDTEQNRIETSRPMPADPGAKGKPAGKEGEKTAKVSGFNVKVGPEGPPLEIRKLRDGTLVGRYADGTKRIVEEAEVSE